MDHEVVPRPWKFCEWLLKLVSRPLPFTPRSKCQSDHEVWGPRKPYSKAYIIHCHGPTCFVLGEAKEVLWLLKKNSRAHGREILLWYNFNELFWGEENVRQKKTREGSNSIFFFKPALFGAYTKPTLTLTYGTQESFQVHRGTAEGT
jgi:hypothetical protein